MLTEDERSRGVAVVVKEMIAQGATPEQIDRYCTAVEVPDDEEPEAEAVTAEAERRRVVKLPTGHEILLENGGFTIPGNYPPEVRRAIDRYMKGEEHRRWVNELMGERSSEPRGQLAELYLDSRPAGTPSNVVELPARQLGLEDALPGQHDYDLTAEEYEADLRRRLRANGEYVDESTIEHLVQEHRDERAHWRQQMLMAERPEMTVLGPAPSDAFSARDYDSAALTLEMATNAQRSAATPSQETAGGMPVPAF